MGCGALSRCRQISRRQPRSAARLNLWQSRFSSSASGRRLCRLGAALGRWCCWRETSMARPSAAGRAHQHDEKLGQKSTGQGRRLHTYSANRARLCVRSVWPGWQPG